MSVVIVLTATKICKYADPAMTPPSGGGHWAMRLAS